MNLLNGKTRCQQKEGYEKRHYREYRALPVEGIIPGSEPIPHTNLVDTWK
jgi:hypothetical protein